MTKKLTSTVAAAAIAMTGMTATPATAMTEEEALLLFAGFAAIAILASSGGATLPAPVTHSTGPILLTQTQAANFDNGAINGPGSDIWFQAVTPTKRYLKPHSGAKFALGDKSNRGYAGCSVASYSSQRINLHHVPVGAYVCVKTSAGRISQFRMNAKFGGAIKKVKLGYTTWQ